MHVVIVFHGVTRFFIALELFGILLFMFHTTFLPSNYKFKVSLPPNTHNNITNMAQINLSSPYSSATFRHTIN